MSLRNLSLSDFALLGNESSKLGKTLPKEQESGVYTLIICKSQSKKSEQKIAQPAGSARSAQSAWSAVCVLS